MSLLPPFELHRPSSLAEAVELAALHAPDASYLAGGTDLLPGYRQGLGPRSHVISLDGIAELRVLETERIGAMVRLAELEESEAVARVHPVLPKASRAIATPLVRASATVGGNLLLDNRCTFLNQSHLVRSHHDFCLKAGGGGMCRVAPQKTTCFATFSADLPAPLLALDAAYHLAGPDGKRTVPARAFYKGDGIARNALRPGEILTGISLPPASRGLAACYEKLRLRRSVDFPEAGIAVAARFSDAGNLREAHICATALATTPLLLSHFAEPFLGQALTPESAQKIGEAVAKAVRPAPNTSMPQSYRRTMAGLLAKRALLGALAQWSGRRSA